MLAIERSIANDTVVNSVENTAIRFNVWPSDAVRTQMAVAFPSRDDLNHMSMQEIRREFPYTLTVRSTAKNGAMTYTVKISASVKRDWGRFGHMAVLKHLSRWALQNLR